MDIEALRACEYWTEREGRAALALWRRSKMELAPWARSVGLSASRLSYWRKRSESPSSERSATADAIAITLAPVTVLAATSRGTITLELRSGRAVRIEGDFDDATLTRVIAIAERAPC